MYEFMEHFNTVFIFGLIMSINLMVWIDIVASFIKFIFRKVHKARRDK